MVKKNAVKQPESFGKGNATFVDTNIPVHDPKSMLSLQGENENTIFLIRGVLTELDGLKDIPDIGMDVREALRYIEEERLKDSPYLQIYRGSFNWKNTMFKDKNKVDNQIIAAAYAFYEQNKKSKKYAKIKVLSNDRMVRIMAREVFRGKPGVSVEQYHKNESSVIRYQEPKELVINSEDYETEQIDPEKYNFIAEENEGVILRGLNEEGKVVKKPASIRKGMIVPISNKISACGMSPISINGNGTNWSQYFALDQLLNDNINLVFLLGGAGTGKTFLALAAAIEKRDQYRQILVSRPMVHLEDKDNMGFLPGDVREKMGPWLRPIMQNLSELKVNKQKQDLIDRMLVERKIDIEPLDYIRGTTFNRCYLIIDEAQNLTPHQIKTIITRAGEGSKIVFTADLDQIDRRRRLNKKSSGPNYAANALRGQSIVGLTTFKDSVRSELTQIAIDLLK